jgi:small nuclear ribonucleoprotein G
MAKKAQTPELKKLMDKRLAVKLNANRRVVGILRGYDQFLNIVLEETIDDTPLPPPPKPEEPTASAVPPKPNIGLVVIRGNSIISMEPLEPLT